MKRFKGIISLVFIVLLMCTAPVLAAPTVNLDGRQLSFEVPPTIENGRTLVPLRAIFEAMGATVTWDQTTYCATAAKGDTTVVLNIGSTVPTVNGHIKQLDVPAKIVNGRTLAPLRFVGEAFGGTVHWDPNTQLISMLSAPGSEPAAQTKVHFIDVGQADCIYIQMPDNNDVLIDGGNVEDGPAVVRYLKSQGVDDIELIIATHPHEDHIGGLPAVMDAFKVEKIIDSGRIHTTSFYRTYLAKVKAEGAIYEENNKQTVNWGNIVLKIFTGDKTWQEINNESVICQLDTGEIEFLFMGDAEILAESLLPVAIRSDVLKVGHHGSDTSTGVGFLSRVAPKTAIISVGNDNVYGHPSPQTLSTIQAVGATIYRTDLNGNIIISTDGKTYAVSTAKNLPVPIAQLVTPEPMPPAQSRGLYMGSSKSDKFHYPNCSSGQTISLANRIWFASEAEAIAMGYVPCKVCKP